jgi:AN1-type zinc finger and ubiquitin domain-containing protein 1
MLPTNQTPPPPSSQRTSIPINIETLAGTSFELLVSPYEQIQTIKRRIERREGIPVSHQHLVWKSNELEDESCLNDYNIEAGTTIKLVLAMRGGPVNTKRVPIEDSLIRDMSEYIESSRDDYGLGNDLLPSSNKNVTFLVLRDGDQFNFFQVIDRGDGTLSPLSGSMRLLSSNIKINQINFFLIVLHLCIILMIQ